MTGGHCVGWPFSKMFQRDFHGGFRVIEFTGNQLRTHSDVIARDQIILIDAITVCSPAVHRKKVDSIWPKHNQRGAYIPERCWIEITP